MSITTKTGDNGTTGLRAGIRVLKDDVRVETCGSLDELSAFLGWARSCIRERAVKETLESIQRDLLLIGSEIAAPARLAGRLRPRLGAVHIGNLEARIAALEKSSGAGGMCFCLPGADSVSGSLHIARTVTRRVERCLVTLTRKKGIANPCIVAYLNRLSDFLYLLARSYEKKSMKAQRKEGYRKG